MRTAIASGNAAYQNRISDPLPAGRTIFRRPKAIQANNIRVHTNARRDFRAGTAGFACKIADTRREREQALRLLYNTYLLANMSTERSHQMRVVPHHLLPTTDVFIAAREGEVISTLTLVRDGELGLPMESVFAAEVAAMRSQGLRLGEIACLATGQLSFRQFLPVFCELVRLMTQYARHHGLDRMVAAVQPKHARFLYSLHVLRAGGGVGRVSQHTKHASHPDLLRLRPFQTNLPRAPRQVHGR